METDLRNEAWQKMRAHFTHWHTSFHILFRCHLRKRDMGKKERNEKLKQCVLWLKHVNPVYISKTEKAGLVVIDRGKIKLCSPRKEVIYMEAAETPRLLLSTLYIWQRNIQHIFWFLNFKSTSLLHSFLNFKNIIFIRTRIYLTII